MKSIEELYSGILADLCERTGTQISGTSEMAVRLYAVAAQIHALYVQGEWVARQCFPQTAQGEYLDRHAALRGLSRRGAARAQGTLCFLVDGASGSDLAVPLGTVCMTAEGPITLEMEKYFQRVDPEQAKGMKAQRVLELNPDAGAFAALRAALDSDREKAGRYAQLLYSQALLIAGLPLEDPVGYTELVCALMQ